MKEGSVAIIGAGIAGCSLAYSLALRGWEVVVLEAGPGPASGASGNREAVLMPYPTRSNDAVAQLSVEGFLFSLALYRELQTISPQVQLWEPGVLRLAIGNTIKKFMESLTEESALFSVVSPEDASRFAEIPLTQRALHFYNGASVSPREVCRALLASPGITTYFNQRVCSLTKTESGSTQSGWETRDARNNILSHTDKVVLCNAYSARLLTTGPRCPAPLLSSPNPTPPQEELSLFRLLPIEAVKGEVLSLPSTPASLKLSKILCHDGYITPARDGYHTVGSTYDHNVYDVTPAEDGVARILGKLGHHIPSLYELTQLYLTGSAGISSDEPAVNTPPPNQAAQFQIMPPQIIQSQKTQPQTTQSQTAQSIVRVSFRGATPDRLPLVGPLQPLLEAWRETLDAPNQSLLFNQNSPLVDYQGLYLNLGFGSRGFTTAPLCSHLLAAFMEDDPTENHNLNGQEKRDNTSSLISISPTIAHQTLFSTLQPLRALRWMSNPHHWMDLKVPERPSNDPPSQA